VVEPLVDGVLPDAEPDAPAEPDEPPEAAEPWLSLFFSVEEDAPAAAEPSFFGSVDAPALPPAAAEPSLLPAGEDDEDLPDAPPAAEPLTPRAERVFSSS